MIRAVIFDLDETLHRRAPSIARFARDLHCELAPDQDEASFVETFLELDERGYRPRESLFSVIVDRYRLNIDPADLVDRFRRSAWSRPILFDGAIESLRQLKRRQLRLGIITNGSEQSQTAKIQNSGLHREVDACLISGVIGIKKPDARIFAMMCVLLEVAAEECLMVGDSLELDIEGGVKAGLQTLWLAPPGETRDRLPDGCLGRISSVDQIVETVFALG